MRIPTRTLWLPSMLLGAMIAAPAPEAEAQSAKAAAQVANLAVMATTSGGELVTPWQTILSSTIRTSQQKDLTVGVSLESTLLTHGLARSRNKTADKSMASAGIEVQVLVDGQPAYPGVVVFNKRKQELTATFQGILAGCLTADLATGAVVIDEDCVEPEELDLLLDTTSANHFNFVLDDVGVGVHSIQVQARIDLSASSVAGRGEAKAVLGKGSVVVEEVRLVKGAEVFEP
jgi:hypothetical protein